MTIAQEVTTLRSGLPDLAAFKVFDRDLERFAAAATPAVEPGTRLPEPELLDAHGATTTLTAARDGGPAVVVFYRGAWCPYCNITLRVYRDELADELSRRGVTLIALSPQSPDGSLSMAEKNELSFPVLSDPGSTIARALGITFEPAADVVAAQGELGLVVADHNAGGEGTLPMPTVLVLDAEGTVRWSDVCSDYTSRTEAREIIAALDAHL